MGVGARDLLEDSAGHGAAEKYLPMIGSIGMFVLMSNLISLIPGFFLGRRQRKQCLWAARSWFFCITTGPAFCITGH